MASRVMVYSAACRKPRPLLRLVKPFFGERLVDAIVEAADELVLPGLASGALLACVD